MQCIYIRHGSTSYSLDNLFAGRKNLPVIFFDEIKLDEAFVRLENLKPDFLVHSPLLRTVQTAELFYKKYNFKNIICEPLLIERDFGVFEGLKKTPENRLSLEAEISVESIEMIESRVKDFTEKYKGKKLLVVGHSAFYKFLIKFCTNFDKEELSCCESANISI